MSWTLIPYQHWLGPMLEKGAKPVQFPLPRPKSHKSPKRIPYSMVSKATERSRRARTDAPPLSCSHQRSSIMWLMLFLPITGLESWLGRVPDNTFHPEPSETGMQPPSLPSFLKKKGERLDVNCPDRDPKMGFFLHICTSTNKCMFFCAMYFSCLCTWSILSFIISQ